MKYTAVAISLLLFTSCVSLSKKESVKKGSYNIIVNSGTICLSRVDEQTLRVAYFPLNSKCKSSSLYSWKMNSIDSKANGSNLKIETYSLYKFSNSKIASKDCAGAGVKVKNISISSNTKELFWGDERISNISNIKNRSCFTKKDKKLQKSSFSSL